LIPHDVQAIGIEFSADGKQLLISTSSESLLLMDAFSGEVQKLLTGHVGGYQLSGLECCFTPDGHYVIMGMYPNLCLCHTLTNTLPGSQDGNIHIWDTKTGQPLLHTPLDGHSSQVTALKFNPQYMMLASAGSSLVRRRCDLFNHRLLVPHHFKVVK
jgi:COMPASS component SWD2